MYKLKYLSINKTRTSNNQSLLNRYMQKNVLLINLGSPKSLKLKDVRAYLFEFLSDKFVIDLPKLLQQLIVRLIILPFRSPKTRNAYKTIWTSKGSPLIENTRIIAQSLKLKTGWNVDIAMRYQDPSIKESILLFKKRKVKEIIIAPLYPHHAMSTTYSTKVEVDRIIKKYYPELQYSIIKPFYDHPKYIHALSEQIKPLISNKMDKVIFSYHGLPERHMRKSDVSGKHCLQLPTCCEIDCKPARKCYRSNVLKTSELVAEKLNLNKEQCVTSFQSRVTIIDRKWLKPFTDIVLKNFPKKGVKNIVILCPSFIVDCLETLEEIDIRARELFYKAGGKKFIYAPCLNNDKNFIGLLEQLITDI